MNKEYRKFEMTLEKHIVLSGVTTAIFSYFSQSWPGLAACFLGGVFIDLDHFLDYCIIKRRICLSVKKLEDYCLKEKSGKLYLILHSYELLLAGWIITSFFNPNPIFLGLLFGLTVHMIFDQLLNPVYPMAYFLTYRAWFGFPKKVFFSDNFAAYLKERRS